MTFVNGEVYEGEFNNDIIDGNGKFYTMYGDTIDGIWEENNLVHVN